MNKTLRLLSTCQQPPPSPSPPPAAAKPRKPFTMPTVKRAAIASTSRNIFENLALEHWLYKHYPQPPYANNHLLMLWVNDPCVVIGRHQNPWAECNAPWMRATATPLARRNSGGGTVYHDAGNLNLTFFTPNAHYNRRANLDFIAATIREAYAVGVAVNAREDLVFEERKISGTAAKLARHCAYHHCTLLINADSNNLRSSLADGRWRITSKATQSTKSPITNLRDQSPHISVDNLITTLSHKYLQWNNLNLLDTPLTTPLTTPPKEHNLEKQPVDKISLDSLHLQLVTPSEANFPGLNAIYEEYRSWEWIYGKTPEFTAAQTFSTVASKQSGRGDQPKVFFNTSKRYNFELVLKVENCKLTDVCVTITDCCNGNVGNILDKLEKIGVKVGVKYDVELLERIESEFDVVESDTEEFTAVVR